MIRDKIYIFIVMIDVNDFIGFSARILEGISFLHDCQSYGKIKHVPS